MRVIESISEMRAVSRKARAEGNRVGFVPTMGYLHEGHLSLVRKARQMADVVVVSVFVNPIQFGPGEDLDAYPRDFERDRDLCRNERVDVCFFPCVEEMFGSDHNVYIEEARLTKVLCGATRPTHFRGVMTVVAKLFNVVEPDIAVFGRKDAQQARIIECMVKDLNFGVQVVTAPIVREPDGLAMSSRNRYLSEAERKQAVCLYNGLCLAERLYGEGEVRTGPIREGMRRLIDEEAPLSVIDYIEAVDYESLRPVERVDRETLIALAVRIGKTRLIDNTVIG
jgi:pantoate--beta-alanine ligase